MGDSLVGWALTSGLWASDPLFVFRKGLILVATTAFGIYFGTRYRRDEQVALVCYAISLLGAVSLVTVVFFPQYGIDHFIYSGDWRGVFPHKNVLGKVMVLGALALCLSSRKWVKSEVLRFVWLVGLITLIVLSRSMTAAVVGAVLLVLVLTYTFLRSPVTLQISIVAMVLVVLVAVVTVVEAQPHVLLDLLGRDATFTGRTGLSDCSLGRYQQEAIAGVRIRVILERSGGSVGIGCRCGPLDPSSRSQRLLRSLVRPGCSWSHDIRNRLCSAFQDCDRGISSAGVPDRHVASRVSQFFAVLQPH